MTAKDDLGPRHWFPGVNLEHSCFLRQGEHHSWEDKVRHSLYIFCFDMACRCIPEKPRSVRCSAARVLTRCMMPWYRQRVAAELRALAGQL